MIATIDASRAPKTLYKYMKAAHLEMTLRRGSFRIGTLHEYRDIDGLGPQIGDDGEGKREIYYTATEPTTIDMLSNDPRAAHARKIIKGWDELPSGSKVILQMQPDSSLALYEDTTDAYMYCSSVICDAAQMRAFGYDACLEIEDPVGFFTELSNCIPNATLSGGAEVQYRDRRVDHSEMGIAPPCFLKPTSYTPQREFRTIWIPDSQPIKPLVIECPLALQYCTPLDVT